MALEAPELRTQVQLAGPAKDRSFTRVHPKTCVLGRRGGSEECSRQC